MRRVILILALILSLAAVPASAGKIGFVNAERAVAQVDEGRAKFEELRGWQEPQQARLESLRDRIMALREQFAREQESATPEALAAIERNELEARRAFEDARREYERELEARKNAFLDDIAVKIGTLGKEYAEANGYDAVFLLTGQPMVYVSSEADLTEILVEMYNERYPASDQ
jgi:Skp family chaperone for outer membrane proteins